MKTILIKDLTQSTPSATLSIQKLMISSPPDKTTYVSGEPFNKTGLQVTGIYGVDGNIFETLTADVTDIVSISPTIVTDSFTEVTISLIAGDGKKVEVRQPVTVIRSVDRWVPDTEGLNLVYEHGDTVPLTLNGTFYFSDGTTALAVGNLVGSATFSRLGIQRIRYSARDSISGTAGSGYVDYTVEKKSVPKPTWKSNLVYNGASQSVNSEAYWNNYNKTYFTIQNYEAQNAGTYTAIFVLGYWYRWDDKSIDNLEVEWVIDKAQTQYIVVDKTIDVADSNVYTTQVALKSISRVGVGGDGSLLNVKGDWSLSPSSINGLTTFSINDGGTIIYQGDGATPIDATKVIVTFSEDSQNYTTVSGTITITALYDPWGEETDSADEQWFANLGKAIKTMTSEEKQALIGMTKSVTLTEDIGVFPQTHLIQCIGVDQDGENTITFQTKNASNNAYNFGSSIYWINSNMRNYCQQYYNAFPGKKYIKTVKKGTCASQDDKKNAIPDYYNETVFLPSEREMGLNNYSPLSTANSTTTKAECTYGYNDYYHYYTSNSLRVKKNGDSGTSCIYWERSLYYFTNYSNYVCYVNSYGDPDYTFYSYSHCWAPAFVIHNPN